MGEHQIQGGFHARRIALAYRDTHPDHHSSVSFQCRLATVGVHGAFDDNQEWEPDHSQA
jgi:hypothetical protein